MSGDFTRINTNVQALQSLGQLQQTNSELGVRQLRLATGSRINRAEDDSAGYTIAKKLESKTRGQAQALSNIGDAKGMLTVGEGSLNSVMDILQTMKEKAVQAANDTMGADERTAISNQLTELRSEITATLGSAEWNGVQLFDGDGGAQRSLSFQVGADSADTFGVNIAKLDTTELQLEAGAYGVSADVDYSSWGDVGTATSIVQVGAGTYAGSPDSFTFEVTDITGQNVTLEVTNKNGDKSQYVYDATDASATGDSTLDTSGVGTVAEGLVVNFEDLAGNAVNATANGAGAFQVGDSFTVDVTKGGIGVADASEAATTISNIDAAIKKVSESVASLGDAQSRLSFKQDNLQNAMTNYDSARSRIEDADFAKEQMEIVKLQILQQTGIASLAQANSAPQGVLSLLR